MRVYASAFSTPKAGSTAAEYEDAYWLRSEGEQVSARHRFAIADGATESSLARDWAHLLVTTFGERTGQRHPSLSGAVRSAQASWPQHVQDYKTRRGLSGTPLQWFEETKLDSGAFATFLTLEIVDPHHSNGGAAGRNLEAVPGGWNAAAVGDSCLFHVRDDELVGAFPLASSGLFGCSPSLVRTSRLARSVMRKHIQKVSGTWLLDDTFYLGTDAIARWFLEAYECGETPWESLRDLGTPEGRDFGEFISDLRSRGCIRNDDVTLLRIDII